MDVSFCIFILYSFCSSIWEISIDISSSSLILSSAMPSLLMSPWKVLFICYDVSYLGHFLLIFSISISLIILPICFYMLSVLLLSILHSSGINTQHLFHITTLASYPVSLLCLAEAILEARSLWSMVCVCVNSMTPQNKHVKHFNYLLFSYLFQPPLSIFIRTWAKE